MLRSCRWTMLLLAAAAGCDNYAGDMGKRLLNQASGRTPINAANQLENADSADQRREGIARLDTESFGRRTPYTTRYQQIAESDSDWLVRAMAVRALNRSRDATATPLFIRGLTDENDIVRTECAKALVHMPDQNAVSPLLSRVTDANENRDVRIWSADALQHYRTLEVARTLANQLNVRDFGVAWQSHRSLVEMTGTDLRYDESAWLEYLTGPAKPFG